MRELIDAFRVKAIWDSPYLLCHCCLLPVVVATGMELEPLEQANGLELSGPANARSDYRAAVAGSAPAIG